MSSHDFLRKCSELMLLTDIAEMLKADARIKKNAAIASFFLLKS